MPVAVNFHQLHIFHTVAEYGSFSAAAQSLKMTQPAITMQVQALEEYFGAKLFHRTTKRVELSDAGKVLLPYARQAITLMRETDQAMADYTKMLSGRMQLGASLTIGEYILPRLLGPFAHEYPDITISLKVLNTSQIIEEIIQHQLTFGLVEAPTEHPDIHSDVVLSDELLLIMPRDHPLSAADIPTFDQVLEYPFVLREQGSGTRQVMEDEMRRKGYDPAKLRIVMELGSTGAVKSAVEAGLGLSVLSQSSFRHELVLGTIVAKRIRGLSFVRDFHAVYLKSTLLPISAVTFLSFLKKHDLDQWL